MKLASTCVPGPMPQVSMVLCVFFLLVDEAWHYSTAVVPEAIISQLLPRRDLQIGLFELLAPILAIGTWPEFFSEVIWSAWIDNQGVLGALKGSELSDDMNFLLGELWLFLANAGSARFVERVESKANVADGPTRHDLSFVSRSRAVFREPRWPEWTQAVWQMRV